MRPEETRAGALKRKNQALEEQHAQMAELYGYLRTKSEPEAIEILRRLRSTDDLVSILNFVKDGDLLLQTRLYTGSPEDLAQSGPVIDFGTTEEYAHSRSLLEKMREEGSMRDFRFPEGETPERSRRRLSPSVTALRIDPATDVPPIRASARPWTNVINDDYLMSHLLSLYFTWEQPGLCYLDTTAFLVDLTSGDSPRTTKFCSPLLVNAILMSACVSRLSLPSSFPSQRAVVLSSSFLCAANLPPG